MRPVVVADGNSHMVGRQLANCRPTNSLSTYLATTPNPQPMLLAHPATHPAGPPGRPPTHLPARPPALTQPTLHEDVFQLEVAVDDAGVGGVEVFQAVGHLVAPPGGRAVGFWRFRVLGFRGHLEAPDGPPSLWWGGCVRVLRI